MDEITLSNSTRILKFVQLLKLDFNEYSIWNYSRKKFHLTESERPLIAESLEFLQNQGFIERVRRAGYYRLSVKGENFISWDLEKIEDPFVEAPKREQKSWRSWMQLSKA